MSTREIIVKGKNSEIDFFKRLIFNIQSKEEKTREFASEILCDFFEFSIEGFALKTLQEGIEVVIEQLRKETNVDVEHKLVESIFEFIWSEKMSKEEEEILLIHMTTIASIKICHYLDEEEYLKIPEVANYVKEVRK